MKPDHKAAAKYAKAQIDFYRPACTEDSNIAAAYLDLREKAKAVDTCRIAQEYASRENWLADTENFIAALNALREILEEK